jgi:hypothetical protein
MKKIFLFLLLAVFFYKVSFFADPQPLTLTIINQSGGYLELNSWIASCESLGYENYGSSLSQISGSTTFTMPNVWQANLSLVTCTFSLVTNGMGQAGTYTLSSLPGSSPNWTFTYYDPSGVTYTNITLTCTNNQAGYVNVAQFEKNGVYIDSQDLAPYAGCSRTYQVQVSGGVISPNYTVQLLPGWPVSTNTVVTLHNPANSGVVDSATWTFDGMLFDYQQNIMPGQTVSRSHICSTIDPVDTFTGELDFQQSLTTNVTGTVLNDTQDKVVRAWWNFNGVCVKNELLNPGQSDSLSENVSTVNNTDSFEWGYTVYGDFTGGNTGTSTNTQGGITSGGLGTNPVVQAPSGGTIFSGMGTNIYTNNIIYAAGESNLTGFAMDSTLRSVGGALHNDNLNTLAGMSILHNDIQSVATNLNVDFTTQFGLMTNEAGQQVAFQSILTNDLWQIVRAVTNGLSNAATNSAGNTNVNVCNWPTNLTDYNLSTTFGTLTNDLGQTVEYEAILTNDMMQIVHAMTNFGTNAGLSAGIASAIATSIATNFPTNISFSMLTNYALESTLDGISNLLGYFEPDDTNDDSPDYTNTFTFSIIGATNYQQAIDMTSDPNIVTVESGLISYGLSIVDFSASWPDYYPPQDMTFDFATVGLHYGVINFDPLTNKTYGEQFTNLFNLAHQLFSWAIVLAFLIKISSDGFRIVSIMNQIHGISGQSVSAEIKKSLT